MAEKQAGKQAQAEEPGSLGSLDLEQPAVLGTVVVPGD